MKLSQLKQRIEELDAKATTKDDLSSNSFPKAKSLQWQERSTTCFVAETPIGAYWVKLHHGIGWIVYFEGFAESFDICISAHSDSGKQQADWHWAGVVLSLLEPETLNAQDFAPTEEAK